MKSFNKSIISVSGEEDSSDCEAGWNSNNSKKRREQTDPENVTCMHKPY